MYSDYHHHSYDISMQLMRLAIVMVRKVFKNVEGAAQQLLFCDIFYLPPL